MSQTLNGVVTPERNEMRRAHRVPIPMFVEIGGTTFRTRDWSLTGFGALEFPGHYNIGDKLAISCILPMREAAMRVDAQAVFRGRRGDVSGFEFEDLSPQKRRILRHYIEMAIEGRLDRAEDLVATASLPGINTPIEQALPLIDAEEQKLQREFHWKSALMILAGVLLILVIAATVFYNRVFRLESVGLISGTIEQVTANSEGVLGPVRPKEGVFLDKGQELFRVEDAEMTAELEFVESQIKQIKEAREQQRNQPPALAATEAEEEEATPTLASINAESADDTLLGSLQEGYDEARLELANAQKLFAERLITNKDFQLAKNHYQRARVSLLREMSSHEAPVEERPLPRAQPSSPSERQLEKELGQLEARRKGLQERLANRTVVAPVRGKVFNVARSPGEFVRSNDVVMLMEEDATPFVLVRVMNEDALKLKPGMPATINMPSTGHNYQAKVAGIGYSSVNADATATMEVSLKETVVRLDFTDRSVRAPLNSRVRVFIRTL